MKTQTQLSIVLCAAAATFAPAAHADDLPAKVKDMDCLVGNWKASGTVTMGSDKADVKATWKCARTPGKFGVMCGLELTGIPGLPVYAETDLFGYEPGTDTYHWFSVTNAGETHDHVAAIPAGDHVQFVYSGRQEGKPFKEVIDMTFGKDGKTFTLVSETFLAGASTSKLQLSARK
jgi:hypothetical protein